MNIIVTLSIENQLNVKLIWLNPIKTEVIVLPWLKMTLAFLNILLCIQPWNIYASEQKYIGTVLMKDLSERVLVWKFTLTLKHSDSSLFFPALCLITFKYAERRKAAAGKQHFRGSVGSCFYSPLCRLSQRFILSAL